jgi:hypothetical protein
MQSFTLQISASSCSKRNASSLQESNGKFCLQKLLLFTATIIIHQTQRAVWRMSIRWNMQQMHCVSATREQQVYVYMNVSCLASVQACLDVLWTIHSGCKKPTDTGVRGNSQMFVWRKRNAWKFQVSIGSKSSVWRLETLWDSRKRNPLASCCQHGTNLHTPAETTHKVTASQRRVNWRLP